MARLGTKKRVGGQVVLKPRPVRLPRLAKKEEVLLFTGTHTFTIKPATGKRFTANIYLENKRIAQKLFRSAEFAVLGLEKAARTIRGVPENQMMKARQHWFQFGTPN